MRFETRPLSAVWPTGARTPEHERRWGSFRVPLARTMILLQYELRHLQAVEPIVLEAGYEVYEIRLDGRPKANARPRDPAVIVSFDSRLGPLRYACDAFNEHAANLRAIALTLEALRAVDRYGCTTRAEQYQGWSALPPTGERGMPPEEAETLIRHLGARGAPDDSTVDLDAAYRRAAARLHPDVDGDPAEWAKLDRARQALGL